MIHTYAPTTVHRRRWVPVAVLGALAVAAGITVAVVLATSSEGKTTPSGFLTGIDPLVAASTACAAGTLGDDNHTLIVDMEGEDLGSGTATIDDVLCVLGELEAPQSVLAQMESTRALDGMQSATWSTYKATWTYHPDDGLDLILTETA